MKNFNKYETPEKARQAWIDDAENWDEFGNPKLELHEWLYKGEELKDGGVSMSNDMAVPDNRQVESRAEALMAMDVLMKHVNDEDEQTDWLANGVPDGAPTLMITREQFEYYSQFVEDFEDIVRIFARTVRRICFKTTYEPKGFC